MSDKELSRIVRAIQSGEINKAERVMNMFRGLIYKNSYIDGKLDEDCVQELYTKLIDCLLSFKLSIDTDIRKFI